MTTGGTGENPAAAQHRQLVYVEALLKETREEISRADTKAGILLSAAGVIGGVLLTGALAGQWSPRRLEVPAEAVWWCAAAAGAYGVLMLALAVLPGVRHPHPLGALGPPSGGSAAAHFYGDVAALGGVDELREVIARDAQDLLTRHLSQLWTISRLVQRKYRRIRTGLFALGCAILGLAATLAVQAALR